MGSEVSDTEFLETLGDDERDRIAALVADNFATQVLIDGFYHADPHSGNVLIKEPVPKEPAEEEEAAEAAEAEAAKAVEAEAAEGDEDKIPLPDHNIEWIDFGMMGIPRWWGPLAMSSACSLRTACTRT